jgi:two-component system phosphate regulon response regulator PhoB
MLTARGEEIDKVVGFEVGADDYVVKPFNVRELLLRIRAILRRAQPDPRAGDKETQFGLLRIDFDGHRVWVDNKDVALTAMEFKLLSTFLTRKGRVQSRDTLLNDVWGMNAFVQTRTVDAHVKRLREKLGPAGEYVETIRGVGYRFRDRLDGLGA